MTEAGGREGGKERGKGKEKININRISTIRIIKIR